MNQLTTQPGQSPNQVGAVANALQSREGSEVLAACMVARHYPRDEFAALARIKRACSRPRLAELAEYAYKRGNSTVSGPSIRLAEAVAQAWGNLDHGWREIERRPHINKPCLVSVVQAYAWDLETNFRKVLVFDVPHWRDTKQGGYALQDERDIYELCANQASRRVRNCILALVPGDVMDEAQDAARETLERGNKGVPIADRIRAMSIAFENEFGVTRKELEARLQHKLEATTEPELRQLKQVFAGIRDGMTTVAAEFRESDTVEALPQRKSVDPFADTEPASNVREMKAGERTPRAKTGPKPGRETEPEPAEEAVVFDDLM